MAYNRKQFPLKEVLAGVSGVWLIKDDGTRRYALYSYMAGGSIPVPNAFGSLQRPISRSLKIQFPELYEDAVRAGLESFLNQSCSDLQAAAANQAATEAVHAQCIQRFSDLLAKIVSNHPQELEVAPLPKGDETLIRLLRS